MLVLRAIGRASSWYDEALPCLFLDPRKGVRGLARLKQHGASSWPSRETSAEGLPRAVSDLSTNSSRRHSHTTATTTGASVSAERPIPGDARRSLLGPAQDRVDEDPVLIRTEPIAPKARWCQRGIVGL